MGAGRQAETDVVGGVEQGESPMTEELETSYCAMSKNFQIMFFEPRIGRPLWWGRAYENIQGVG